MKSFQNVYAARECMIYASPLNLIPFRCIPEIILKSLCSLSVMKNARQHSQRRKANTLQGPGCILSYFSIMVTQALPAFLMCLIIDTQMGQIHFHINPLPSGRHSDRGSATINTCAAINPILLYLNIY